MSLYDSTGIQYFKLNNFTFIDQTTLPIAQVAYREFNPTCKKTALIPTCFRGRINTTWNFSNGALKEYRVIVVALFGNGESSSPSNTSNFPSSLDYRDCVEAQHKLITDQLKISYLDVMVGFSMGGQCTYHWAAMYPEMVSNAVVICSSAKTSLHNYQFLEGPKASLLNSIDYADKSLRSLKQPPIRGLHAFGRAYSAWLTSAEWFEQRLFESQGFTNLQDWGAHIGGKNYEDWDPDNLLVMVGMWQRSDLSLIGGQQVSLAQALGDLKTRILVMPCQTDQYFKWEASEKEVSFLGKAVLAVIPSLWGHLAGSGCNPEDTRWMDDKIADFLNLSKS